jgi:hypothetical protein
MSKLLAGIAGLSLIGLAAMPVTTAAAERQDAATNSKVQSTDLSSRHRRWHRYRYGYYRPYYYRPYRRYYYGAPYPYAYGYPYGYYRPGIAFGLGPFGFRAF